MKTSRVILLFIGFCLVIIGGAYLFIMIFCANLARILGSP